MTHIDTGSHNKLDLLQSLVPTHCCYHDWYWYWFTQQAWPATKSCTNTLLLSWLILILVHTTSLTCYKVLYQHTVAIMTDIDTSSHNKLDLIQSLVPRLCIRSSLLCELVSISVMIATVCWYKTLYQVKLVVWTSINISHDSNSVLVQDFVSGQACCVNQYQYESW
jgi:hypothetical protein